MTIIEIKHRRTGAVLFSIEAETLRAAVEAAVAKKANLSGANLYGAINVPKNILGRYREKPGAHAGLDAACAKAEAKEKCDATG